ncbi:MAG: hypothetical protein BWY95_02766 [Bacteroidetes bacterium ADurb.BinA104]|nr:MAG: hypothetical protein BWY95_02766 [Bacteroidetes bacterium ADurb.BinA104]
MCRLFKKSRIDEKVLGLNVTISLVLTKERLLSVYTRIDCRLNLKFEITVEFGILFDVIQAFDIFGPVFPVEILELGLAYLIAVDRHDYRIIALGKQEKSSHEREQCYK